MPQVSYDKQITALLVIDPYNDFISEGGKLWGRIRAVAEANDCVPHMLQVLKCRPNRGDAGLLRATSSLPSGRLRDLEIHCACSTSGMEEQKLRIRHMGR